MTFNFLLHFPDLNVALVDFSHYFGQLFSCHTRLTESHNFDRMLVSLLLLNFVTSGKDFFLEHLAKFGGTQHSMHLFVVATQLGVVICQNVHFDFSVLHLLDQRLYHLALLLSHFSQGFCQLFASVK